MKSINSSLMSGVAWSNSAVARSNCPSHSVKFLMRQEYKTFCVFSGTKHGGKLPLIAEFNNCFIIHLKEFLV